MKKVLCIAMMMVIAVAITHAAEEENEPGNFGLGYQGVVVSDGHDQGGPDLMNAIALRWAPKAVGGSITLGQYGYSSEDNDSPANEQTTSALTLQGKVLWTLIDRPNSDFYVGGLLGLARYEQEFTPGGGSSFTEEWTAVIFGGLAGVEWYFTELPEIGFNFEVGYNIETSTFEEPGDEIDTIFAGTSVTMGATYYF